MTVALGVLLTAILLLWVRHALALRRMSTLPMLDACAPLAADACPSLSVVVACRDEAPGVEAAITSLLAQDHPSLQVVAVDDRSTDGTGAILDRLAAADARLRVVHVTALPAGWLGKTHALARGAESADGAWLLFTDADVVFAPDALRRSIGHAIAERAGHLVVLPELQAPGFLERGFVAVFGMFFLLDRRIQDLARPGTRAYVGAGAFNLVQADAYRGIDGHRRLALEVLDDVKLGLLLRRSGVRQRCIAAAGLVRVRWQSGFVASMRGLVKNFFAGLEYRWGMALLTLVGLPLLTTLPAVAVVIAPRLWLRALAAAGAGLSMYLHGTLARRLAGGSGWEGLLLPLVGPCLAFVSLVSATTATLRGSITWRGTRYLLPELERACVREAEWPRDRAVG